MGSGGGGGGGGGGRGGGHQNRTSANKGERGGCPNLGHFVRT